MRVVVQPNNILQLDSEVTLSRAEFNLTYKAAIAALLGVPGLNIMPEWHGFEDPGKCRVSLTLHASVYTHAAVLRDLAETGATTADNAVQLDIHPWKLLQVLAMSVCDEWLAEPSGNGANHIAYVGVLLKVRVCVLSLLCSRGATQGPQEPCHAETGTSPTTMCGAGSQLLETRAGDEDAH